MYFLIYLFIYLISYLIYLIYYIYTIIHTSLDIFTYPCIHLCIYTYVHICVTVQYYSLYRTDPCGCHPHEPTSLPQDFRVPLACHWLWRPSPRPLRLLRLSRLWMLSKTLRETLTRARWQHVSTHNYLTDGGIMDEFTCYIPKMQVLGTSSIFRHAQII